MLNSESGAMTLFSPPQVLFAPMEKVSRIKVMVDDSRIIAGTPLSELEESASADRNFREASMSCVRTSPTTQEFVNPRKAVDVAVRIPSLRTSPWKVTVLQNWTGIVEHVHNDTITAVVSDGTNSRNPPEEVQLDIQEISPSDRSLVVVGALFYWTIGYRDTPGGQRERVAMLRFARQPMLTIMQLNHGFSEADRLAALFTSD